MGLYENLVVEEYPGMSANGTLLPIPTRQERSAIGRGRDIARNTFDASV